MQLQKQKSRKKPLIITSLIVLCVAVAAGAWYVVHTRSQQSESYTTKPATQEEKDAGSQTKQDSINNSSQQGASDSDTSTNSDKQSGTSTDTGTSTTTPTAAITISASTQNGNTYQLRFLINSVVTGGTCQLTLSRGGATVDKQAAIQSLAQSSTCQGFDIPTSELSAGIWNVSMQLSGSSHTGSVTGTIEVR